jgi:hypothetical protein
MAAPTFIAWQADTSTLTGPPATVATSAVAGTQKTILQVKPGNGKIRLVEWGYGFDATPTGPVRAELVTTGTIGATVTSIGGGILPYNDSTGSASQVAVGTAATGFNSSNEGTIVASRLLGYNYDTGLYFKQQFPLAREPEVAAGTFLRVRFTPTVSTASNVWCYLIWEE